MKYILNDFRKYLQCWSSFSLLVVFLCLYMFLINFMCISLGNYRSIRPEVFCEKGGLRNFAELTGKNLCQTLFFKKVAGLSFLKTPFLIEHPW